MKDLIIFSVCLGVLALLNFYRFVKGPNAADRMVAADSTDILISMAMMLFITAMLGIINTMLVGRYLDRRRWVYHDDDDPADNN